MLFVSDTQSFAVLSVKTGDACNGVVHACSISNVSVIKESAVIAVSIYGHGYAIKDSYGLFSHPKENSFSNGRELTRRAWNMDIIPIDALSVDIFRLLIDIAKPTTIPIWLNVHLISTKRRVFPRPLYFHLN